MTMESSKPQDRRAVLGTYKHSRCGWSRRRPEAKSLREPCQISQHIVSTEKRTLTVPHRKKKSSCMTLLPPFLNHDDNSSPRPSFQHPYPARTRMNQPCIHVLQPALINASSKIILRNELQFVSLCLDVLKELTRLITSAYQRQ